MAYVARLKSRSGTVNDDGSRSYTVVYQVQTDALNWEPAQVAAAIGYTFYEQYTYDPAARLKNVNIAQDGDEMYFAIATLEYSTTRSELDEGAVEPGEPGEAPPEPGEAAAPNAPAVRPWVVKWGSVQTERPLVRDLTKKDDFPTGKPVVNSAGQPFDPPVMVPATHPTLSITAWRLKAQPEKILRFVNRVNSKPFMGAKAFHARCTSYTVVSQYEEGQTIWQVDVTIEFSEIPWHPLKVLDAGTVQNIGTSIEPKFRAIELAGAAVTTAVPLDGTGRKLSEAATIAGNFEYLEFRAYDADDFSQLI